MLVEKNGRQFEADGAQAEAPAILYTACRCQEVSDVTWASPKTNILTAGAGYVGTRRCRLQRIVNASRSHEFSLSYIFTSVRFAKLPRRKSPLASYVGPGITIFHRRGISRTHGTFSKPPNCPTNS